MSNPVIVGLTGGIASGKSTVSSHLRELGVYVIDADQVARAIVEPGQPALDEIVARFGQGILDAQGCLDRAALGKIVFEDPEARAALSMITHPRIGQRMMQEAADAFARGHAWVIYDAALLVENNIHTMFDALIVVSLSPERQLERLMSRDGLTEAEAQARIDSQLPLAKKVAVADYIVDNSGTKAQTLQKTQQLYEHISGLIAAAGSAKPQAPVTL